MVVHDRVLRANEATGFSGARSRHTLKRISTQTTGFRARSPAGGAEPRPRRTPFLGSPLRSTCGVFFCGSRTHGLTGISTASTLRDAERLQGGRPARICAPSEHCPVPLGARLRAARLWSVDEQIDLWRMTREPEACALLTLPLLSLVQTAASAGPILADTTAGTNIVSETSRPLGAQDLFDSLSTWENSNVRLPNAQARGAPRGNQPHPRRSKSQRAPSCR